MLVSLFLLAAPAPQIISREPVAATPWREIFAGRCGGEELQVTRPLRPPASRPAVRIGGRAVHGDLQQLESELGEAGAAYRFSILCAQQGGTMTLRWVRGLADADGRVTYRSGVATFRGGALVESASEDSNAETFWYR